MQLFMASALKNAEKRLGIILAALVCLLALAGSGCGLFSKPYKPVLLKTKELVFYLDRKFNQKLALPVDICFVPLKGSAAAIIAVSPEDWFLKDKRDKYPFKQPISFKSGQHSPVTVKLKLPAEPQELVLIANYMKLNGAKGQQIVIPSPGKPKEVVFVTDKGIYR